MNILLVHPHDITSPLEPWTIRAVGIAREFARLGHGVRLVHFPRRDATERLSVDVEGAEVYGFDRRNNVVALGKNIGRMRGLARWADVVHFQKCFHWAALPAALAAFACGKALHYDWDDWEEMIYRHSHPRPHPLIVSFLRFQERWLPRLADTVSVASERLRQLCLERGVPADRLVKVSVGADLRVFSPDVSGEDIRKKYARGGPVVLYLGQLHSAQYAHLFLEAACDVSARVRGAVFLVVGEGSERRRLEDLNRTLGLDSVVFTGHVAPAQVPRYIASADVCVASFEDNDVTRCKSPLKLAEYMACGKAIVASDVGEVKAMVDDAGLIVPQGDKAALAQSILRLLDDARLRQELGRKARRRCERNFSWRHAAEKLLGHYRPIR